MGRQGLVSKKRASVLECGSPLPLSHAARYYESHRPFESGVDEAKAGAWPLCHRTPNAGAQLEVLSQRSCAKRLECGGMSLPRGGDTAFACCSIHEGDIPFESASGLAHSKTLRASRRSDSVPQRRSVTNHHPRLFTPLTSSSFPIPAWRSRRAIPCPRWTLQE
jgi:hypothetical protein